MKKIFPFILLVFALSSCSEDLKFNNEAVFQGVKDNVLWIGSNAKATLDANNKLTIEAVTLTEHMSLVMPVPTTPIDPRNDETFVTYILGTTNTRKATYTLNSNGNAYEYETAIGVGDGQIVVSEYDGATVSGTFRFNVENVDPDSEAPPVVNMQTGTFYKVPVYQVL
jgi:hypothetical protein